MSRYNPLRQQINWQYKRDAHPSQNKNNATPEKIINKSHGKDFTTLYNHSQSEVQTNTKVNNPQKKINGFKYINIDNVKNNPIINSQFWKTDPNQKQKLVIRTQQEKLHLIPQFKDFESKNKLLNNWPFQWSQWQRDPFEVEEGEFEQK